MIDGAGPSGGKFTFLLGSFGSFHGAGGGPRIGSPCGLSGGGFLSGSLGAGAVTLTGLSVMDCTAEVTCNLLHVSYRGDRQSSAWTVNARA